MTDDSRDKRKSLGSLVRRNCGVSYPPSMISDISEINRVNVTDNDMILVGNEFILYGGGHFYEVLVHGMLGYVSRSWLITYTVLISWNKEESSERR